MRKLISIAACLLLLGTLAACGGDVENVDNGHEVIFAASSTTGSFYQFCVPCCELVTKYADGVRLTAISTTGTKESLDLLHVNEVGAAGGPGIMEYYAYTGEGPWAETGPYDIRIAYVCYPDYVQIATTADSDISCIADLAGKRISLNLMESSADLTAQLIFPALGISDYQAYYMDSSDSLSALQEGRIDAMVYCGGLGPSVFMELAASRHGMKLIPFSEAEMDEVAALSQGILGRRSIPAGYYDGIEAEVPTLGSSVPLCVSADLPEDVVYQIVKALDEHHDELVAAIGNAAYATPENTVQDWGASIIPLHPGAEKYFRELGLLD